jgi:hypothetical protein
MLHPRRNELGTSKLPFPLVLHTFKIPSPTDTCSLLLRLLIYLHLCKPVARNFEEIIGFEQEMAEVTA